MRAIKFRIIYKNKVVGYERLVDGTWKWMSFDTNGTNRENWYRGVFPFNDNRRYQRDQFIGLIDCAKTDIYERDIISWDYEYDSDYDGDMPIVKRTTGRAEIKDIFDRSRIFTAAQEGGGVLVIGNTHQNPELLKP